MVGIIMGFRGRRAASRQRDSIQWEAATWRVELNSNDAIDEILSEMIGRGLGRTSGPSARLSEVRIMPISDPLSELEMRAMSA